jgi:hypothetical protein
MRAGESGCDLYVGLATATQTPVVNLAPVNLPSGHSRRCPLPLACKSRYPRTARLFDFAAPIVGDKASLVTMVRKFPTAGIVSNESEG